MRVASGNGLVILFLGTALAIASGEGTGAVALEGFDTKIQEMVSAYSRGTQKTDTPAFKEKVKEIDEELRIALERDHDLTPFQQLLDAAHAVSARKGARQMFEPALKLAEKRIDFARLQKDLVTTEFLEKAEKMKQTIAYCLDPNRPDEDVVDRKRLDQQKAALKKKVAGVFASLQKRPAQDVIKVNVTDVDGKAAKLSPMLQTNLLAKIRSLIPTCRAAVFDITLKPENRLDLHATVQDLTAPNGMSITEAKLVFEDIAFDALKDTSPTEYAGVLDNSTLKSYRSVYSQEQLNSSPFAGSTSYEMGTIAPGKTWRLPFLKTEAISSVVKQFEGDGRFQVLNGAKAAVEKEVEIKNMGEKDFLFLQGSDASAICSVKAVGFLTSKKGYPAFEEVVLLVDDQLTSGIGQFIGAQAINVTLRKAHDEMKKLYPFTMYLEKVEVEKGEGGDRMFIFSGKGKGAR